MRLKFISVFEVVESEFGLAPDVDESNQKAQGKEVEGKYGKGGAYGSKGHSSSHHEWHQEEDAENPNYNCGAAAHPISPMVWGGEE